MDFNRDYFVRHKKKQINARYIVLYFHWEKKENSIQTEYRGILPKRRRHRSDWYRCHPHVIQGIEKYKNGLIAYRLGIFFNPSYDASRETIILECIFEHRKIIRYEYIPVIFNHVTCTGNRRKKK
jgi:poly-gamma-glutamate synthesis protein (capsule biosynthesis protein)